jgi:hypothetical protein
MPDASPADRAAAREFVHANLAMDMAAFEDELTAAYTDAYEAGLMVAAEQTGISAVAGTVLPTTAAGWAQLWDEWQPGNIPAANLLRQGRFADLLADQVTMVDQINGTTLDRLGNLLANGVAAGDSVDTIADSLGSFVDDPDRAYSIADTGCAAAVSTASMDGYDAAGVEQVEWLISPGACDECEDHAAEGPFDLADAPDLPEHENCRCSWAPVDPSPGDTAPADDDAKSLPVESGD